MLRAGAQALVVLALAGASAAPVAAQDRRPLEALIAVVGGETPSATTDAIVLSDVELAARLALARGGRPDAPLTPELLHAALEQLVGETLIRREAARLHAADPTAEAVARQREALERSVGGAAALDALLARLGAGRDELDAMAVRRAVVESFLGANLEGAAEVTDADVERAYADPTHPFVGRPLDEVRDALRAWLRVTRLDADVARWLTTLRRRSAVRVLRPFVAAAAAEGTDAEGTGTDVGAR